MLTYLSKTWTVWLNAIWQQYYVSFNWSLRISRAGAMGAVILGLMLGLVPDNPTSAQVLNQRVVQLLGNNCSGLGAPGGSPSFGANLNAICQFPPTNSSGTAGSGGAASIQASGASILNRTILSRMEEIRAEEGQEDASSSSMRMNPFGVLMPGLFRGTSMASPSSPTGDPTGGTLNFGNATRWKRVGLFASGFVESLNREVGVYQQGYKSTILGFTGGADYRFSKQLTAGLAFTYANHNGDIEKGGNFSTNSYGITLFSQYLPTDNSFVQFTAGYTNNRYMVVRNTFLKLADPGGGRAVNNVGGLPSSNSNGDVLRLGMLTGYDHPIGRFTVGPRIGLNYAYTHIHDYAEQGGQGLGLKYDDQYVNSVQSVLGMQGTVAVSTGFGVLVPQVNADYIHEFANSQRFINVQFTEDQRANPFQFRFQTDTPVRNYFNLGAGLVAVLPNGLQPFVNFRAMVGNNQFDNYAGTFGLRIEM
jgi:outer membrane lipase/esterase